jgi:hypothetical protein
MQMIKKKLKMQNEKSQVKPDGRFFFRFSVFASWHQKNFSVFLLLHGESNGFFVWVCTKNFSENALPEQEAVE